MQSRKIQTLRVNGNDYKFLSLINRGSYGNIYLCQNKTTKQKYVAKLITYENSEEAKQMIEREIQIMMRVVHPTIVKFHGYAIVKFQNMKHMMILMDYYKRGSLAEVLDKEDKSLIDGNYDDTSRQIILVGIAYGMLQLHRKHVIHRDLKPGNVLIDDNFHPCITDFGLSKVYDVGKSSDQTKTCGTVAYIAPEVFKNVKYNTKADVYSFGILMYQVLTGMNPYPEFPSKWSEFELTKRIVDQGYRPQFSSDVKEPLKKLIEQCWAENPEERPTFEEIFNKLAYNQDENETIFSFDPSQAMKSKKDSFYLDGVAVDELYGYIDLITENEESNQEIEELKMIVEKQQKMINQIIEDAAAQNQKTLEQFQEQKALIDAQADLIKKQKEIIEKHEEKIQNQDILLQSQSGQLQNLQNQLKEIMEKILITNIFLMKFHFFNFFNSVPKQENNQIEEQSSSQNKFQTGNPSELVNQDKSILIFFLFNPVLTK